MDQSGLIFPKTQKKKKKRMKHPKSLLHEKNGTCYLCMLLDGNYKKHLFIDEHHIFGGPNRKHSEETGMKVGSAWITTQWDRWQCTTARKQ